MVKIYVIGCDIGDGMSLAEGPSLDGYVWNIAFSNRAMAKTECLKRNTLDKRNCWRIAEVELVPNA